MKKALLIGGGLVFAFMVYAWSTSAASVNLDTATGVLEAMEDEGGLTAYHCGRSLNQATVKRTYWQSIPEPIRPKVGMALTRVCLDKMRTLATSLIRDERGVTLDYYRD